jgi:hypothetical protein
VNVFVFTGLWLLIGAVVLWSPVPGALGISDGFFVAWLMLFFAILGAAGVTLTAAAVNGAFPPAPPAPPRAAAPVRRPAARRNLWAPESDAGGTAGSPPGGNRRPATRREG